MARESCGTRLKSAIYAEATHQAQFKASGSLQVEEVVGRHSKWQMRHVRVHSV